MGELAIRRNRSFAVPQYRAVGKAEKQTGSKSQKVSAGFTVSETLRQLMSRVSQAEGHARESRRTLQTGESVLAEVREDLDRIAELVQEAAGDGEMDREALQEELEQLRKDIDRMTQSASAGDARLFLEEGVEDGTEALLYAVMGEVSARQEVALPDWLKNGLAQGTLDAQQLLAGLGLDKNASPAELLAAIRNSSLEDNPAASRLAVLYLGAVIAGGGTPDPTQALDGLQQLLEKVSEGVPLDQAVEMLTNGEFTSLLDVQEQFTGGTAPGLEDFLVNLLSDSGSLLLSGFPALTLLAEMEGMNLELLMGLMTAAQSTPAGTAPAGTAPAEGKEPAVSALQLGTLQVVGQDLSQVSLNSETGELTIGGTEAVTVLGTSQEGQVIRITGSGTVTLQNGAVSTLTVDAPEARVLFTGETVVQELQLRPGVSLTLDGTGLLKVEVLRADVSNTLRLTGGAVTVLEQEEEYLTVPIQLEGAVSLAAHASQVSSFSGESLKPFDLVWKTLLPGWSSITAMTVDGKQGKMHLMGGGNPDAVRLWLPRGDHGYPHTLALRGRDEVGHLRTRYAYLHWNQNTGTFEAYSAYPNPFTITGGEPDRDWVYEEETHTLHILSNQVTAVSGGLGTDANQAPFSGRIALADHIGEMELALGGVVCRVSSGRAFHLGRKNDVTLILERGTTNLFESGAGCAGISLGEGTCLSIDCAHGELPAGELTATGSVGGAGIGRDSGGGRDRMSRILIRGGVITATGTGGGAGIGAGKRGSMGAITILGGTVTSTGGTGGGAGIGGALGAPVGDISIHGGTVTAVATFHAAAIGAGVQGACGDILITGTARIVKAQGGNPGADIGACLFGNCGNVLISGGADIGNAGLKRRGGIPLQMGEDTVTLPQFRLSSRALQLDRLSVLSREYAQAAKITVDADRRWINQIQAAYDALHNQLDQSFHALYSVHQYIDGAEGSVRDTATASTLLNDMRQLIHLQPSQAMRTHSKRGMEDVSQLLQ